MKHFAAIIPILIGAVLLMSSCKDKPVNIFTIEDDKALGLQISEEIANDTNYKILDESKYPSAYQHLRRIRDSILASGQVPHATDFVWECKILDDTVLNAFCTPGGYIYVYKGIIQFLDNESQFAGVLGHEMAHAARRHSTQQLTQAYGVSVLLSVVLGDDPGLLAQITAQLVMLAFSRSHENDADAESVKYLYSTTYDARGVAGFFEKLQTAQSGGLSIPFLSTHPSDEKRIENINAKWTELGGKTGQLYETSYQAFKNSLPK
ncbi:MAG: M48 family metalloprotease [Sphingobacteriales bacterium]|nr:M48 family metalloprotease [Sphingobacteriales bacterium]